MKELLAISKVMQEGEENVVQMKQGEVTANQSHIEKLRKAKEDAEEQRDDTEKLRVHSVVQAVFQLTEIRSFAMS